MISYKRGIVMKIKAIIHEAKEGGYWAEELPRRIVSWKLRYETTALMAL